jgi:ribonuclease HII
MRSLPAIDRFTFERELLRQGVTRIAGVDEAGRGPLAGPVVAAAAVLPVRWMESRLPRGLRGLNDSKQLTRQQRDRFYQELTSCGEVSFSVARIEAGQVDEFNILQATHRAMNEALAGLLPSPEHVLVDGLRVKTLHFVHTPIIGGDALSYSIAAASVLAKVTRDRLMEEYHQRWPAYGFAEHKGYGTPRHLAALAEHGPCPIHRRSFSPIRQPEAELF